MEPKFGDEWDVGDEGDFGGLDEAESKILLGHGHDVDLFVFPEKGDGSLDNISLQLHFLQHCAFNKLCELEFFGQRLKHRVLFLFSKLIIKLKWDVLI